jgi:hypothetical protein
VCTSFVTNGCGTVDLVVVLPILAPQLMVLTTLVAVVGVVMVGVAHVLDMMIVCVMIVSVVSWWE